MRESPCLWDIRPGQKARVVKITAERSMHRRLLDIGLVEGTLVECLGESPPGDPRAYLIRGAVIAIRSRDCRDILVRKEE